MMARIFLLRSRLLREIGDSNALEEAIDRAFQGAKIYVVEGHARFRLQMRMPGVVRSLEAAELSDGTLRLLCVIAALLSPRPPERVVLNKPETSVHPDLLDPLAGLIAIATASSQLWITTPSRISREPSSTRPKSRLCVFDLVEGETVIGGD